MQKITIQSIISSNIAICDQFDIELIIAHVLNKDRIFTITHNTQILTKKQVDEITELCKNRAAGYPLAYILGEKEFFGRSFKVTEDTLIPRPETEILIDAVLSFLLKDNLSNILIIDIGTGSGIIPITLNKEISTNIIKNILATDISDKALNIASYNIASHNSSNIMLYHSDLLSNTDLLDAIHSTKFEHLIITANLPYVNDSIKTELVQKKESKSLKYEPQIALWSEDAGLSHYKQLITQTLNLNIDVKITSFYEISPEQYPLLKSYLKQHIKNPKIKLAKDLANKERIVTFSINA
ncbi:MAG: peptide chain release factor N(5)-glutamine methyltransferase [Candidatus Moraniibacteriota bacterium]|jgi:release factor glutamine methyltransferase